MTSRARWSTAPRRTTSQLRRLLHDHGFRWSANLNAWYLPRPWTYSTRNRRVSSLTAGLRQAQPLLHPAQASRPPRRNADDSPPEPLPAADPYTDIRQARSDHSRAISDYWALTRTPAGNNVMSTYPESGARPDALALNAAYKAVRVSWEEAFAGDPQEVAGRFTAWVQAASCPVPQPRRRTAPRPGIPADARHLHRLRHPTGQPHPGHRRGPRCLGARVRQSACRQRRMPTPPWKPEYRTLPAAASSPDHGVSPAEDEQARQHSGENGSGKSRRRCARLLRGY